MFSHFVYFVSSFHVRGPFVPCMRAEWIMYVKRAVHARETEKCYKQRFLMKASYILLLPLFTYYI